MSTARKLLLVSLLAPILLLGCSSRHRPDGK
jgi:hypothetical protein